MFNVCPNCGQHSEEKRIDPSGPFAICPFCGHHHRFLRQPLFVLTGASAAGKTTVCLALQAALPGCVVMESDILWLPEFDTPEDDYRAFRNTWLRVAKNIGQAGRPVVLCGTAVPGQYESCPERRYFAAIHYLALVCDDEELVRRLEARPQWRECSDPQFIQNMLTFNRWLMANSDLTEPPMTLLDTTHLSIEQSVERTAHWVLEHLADLDTGEHFSRTIDV